MSDVEELLRTMAAQADRVDPRPPSEIRRSGAKRQRRRRGALGTLLVLACLAASGGIVSLVNRAAPPPVAPPSIGPLRPIGSGVSYGQAGIGSGWPLTSIRGNRAFAAWAQSDQTLAAAAIDLETGHQLWRHHDSVSGIWFDWTGSEEVLVGAYRTAYSPPTLTAVAFDSGTGAVLWRKVFSRYMWQLGDIVVIDTSDGVLGLDLRTGAQVWKLPVGQLDATFLMPMEASRDSADPVIRRHEGWTDHRIVIAEWEGSLRIVNTDTGAVTHETTVPIKRKLDLVGAIDGKAFVVDGNELMMISGDGRSTIYTASADLRLAQAAPCGEGRLCVSEAFDGTYRLTVLDLATKRILLQMPSSVFLFGSASSGYYFISSQKDLRVFEGAGTLVKSFDLTTDRLLTVSTDLVIQLRGNFQEPFRPVPVQVGIGALLAKSSTPIGNLTVFAQTCRATTTTLVCPTETGFQVWRFAAD
jgi:hypothetical protein